MGLIEKGYKQTELGVIPNDWEIKEFQDVMTGFFSGATPYRGRPEYYKGDIKWITSGELNYNIISDTIEKITVTAVKNTNLKMLPAGTFLFAITGLEAEGTRGSCGVTGVEATTNQSCMALVPKETLDSNYLYHFYVWQGKMLALKYCQGTKQQSYTAKIARTLPIILPPTKSEQTAIANSLSDVDALIENLDKLIAKKRSIKQGAMQQLLTCKKRLPGFNKKWVLKSLGEVGELTGSGVDKKIYPNEVPVILVNYLDVYKRDFIFSNDLSHCVTATQQQARKCEVKKGDIFFTPSSEMRYDIALSAVAMEDIPEAVYSYHIVRLRLYEDWDLLFRTYIFKTKLFYDQAERICEGSGKRYVISLSKFRGMNIYYPTDKIEQSAISKILFEIDNEICSLEHQIQKYQMIKQGMMQSLLTGKIRLI